MLKQSFSKAKKVLTILLAILFVASLTVGAASACHSHGHHHVVIDAAVMSAPPLTLVDAPTIAAVIKKFPVTMIDATLKPSVKANP